MSNNLINTLELGTATFINAKEFIAPESVNSTAAIHSKMYKQQKDRPKCQLRITDCNVAMRLWNFCDTEDERKEFVGKVDTIIEHLLKFRGELGEKFNELFEDPRFLENPYFSDKK
ncbi:hypothetical protein BPT24_070 [Tenacibaculum phage pT24]|uniref:Uncharacterized protein n=1 Tax=Tenacibaculum phage pT24 TaxID=1880590 RepID=A0A1B4XWJ7_9CAUD|nr:hypothetical protein HYP10_gp070 [Tenacibaculum phage pT24]BAV39193.1 hypothetical protein BPT24_070 [Tenacibaculum phage pT24]